MATTKQNAGSVTSVDIGEFCAHMDLYVARRERITVTKRGRTVGHFIPAERDEQAIKDALNKLDASMDRLLTEMGMTDDELAAWLDEKTPFKT